MPVRGSFVCKVQLSGKYKDGLKGHGRNKRLICPAYAVNRAPLLFAGPFLVQDNLNDSAKVNSCTHRVEEVFFTA